MKTIGIIGGIAPASTIEYYRLLVSRHRELTPDGSYPSIVINSIDMTRMLALIGAGELAATTDYLVDELDRLARAGAAIGLFASNTPHVVFDAIHRRSPIPLVSIVEAAADEAAALGLRRVGLFGTRFTMGGRFYPEVFAQRGIEIIVPAAAEQGFIHDRYMGELVHGVFRDETRDAVLRIADRQQREDHIEALVLGGTELPLLLPAGSGGSVPFLDTTRIHVEAVLEKARQARTAHPP